MLDTFIFDIDGTLLDTEEAVLTSLQALLKKFYNIEKSIPDLHYTLGIPGLKIMESLGVDPTEGINHWHDELEFTRQLMVPYENVTETIKAIKENGKKLAIVTSKTAPEFDAEVAKHDFVQYFDVIVTSSMTKKHKPEPDPILKGLELLNSKPENAIYFGDTVYDLQSSTAAGTMFGLAEWGAHDNGQFKNADYRFKTPEKILELLD